MLIGLVVNFILFYFSVKILSQNNREKPIIVFKFDRSIIDFYITLPGFYSIGVIGAGHLFESGDVKVKLLLNGQKPIKVSINIPSFRFKQKGQIATEYWGFVVQEPGHYILSFENIENLQAKKSMLYSVRQFERPIELDKLECVMFQTARPIFKILATVALIYTSISFTVIIVSFFHGLSN